MIRRFLFSMLHFPFAAGFTLIEIMVVVAISAIMVSGGLAAYTRYSDRQKIVNAGKRLYNDVRFIQGKAGAGEKPMGCQPGEVYEGTLDGYQLRVVDSVTYALEAVCGGAPADLVRQEVMPVGVSITEGMGVLFRGLGQGVEAGQFCLSGLGYFYVVDISAGGDVRDVGLIGACP